MNKSDNDHEKTRAEIDKLNFEIVKMNYENIKMQAETLKIQAEHRWYPYVTGAAILTGVILVTIAFTKIFLAT